MQRSSGLTVVALAVSLASGCDTGSQLAPQEHLQRAKNFFAKGEINASIIELKNALQQEPDLAEARWILGKAYLEVGNGAGAERELVLSVSTRFEGGVFSFSDGPDDSL